jgi:ATP-dependent DNA helicase RecG
LDETKHLEFKRVRGGEITKILLTLTAFANTAGGLLVLGMEDLRKAQGVDRLYGIEENEAALDEVIREHRRRIVPPLGGELGPEPVFHRLPCTLRNGQPGHLVAVEVRPSRDLHSLAEGGTWERLDKGNRQMTAQEIMRRRLRLGAVSALDYPVDVSVELLDTVWWQDYRNQRGLTRPLEEALKHLGLLKLVDGVWKPTRLAVLLFAEFPSDLLGEKCAIRLFHYQGEQILHVGATTNLVKPPRTIGGPAVRQIREALKAVEEELAAGVQVSPMGFEVIQRYPRRAIQEAITNAVIHRDYSLPADIHIRIFSDRIEVESPGGLPHRLTPQNLGLVRSMPRNPSLVNHLREFPAPPNQDAGEGIPMMRALMRQADLYPPLFLLPRGAEWESVEVALLNEARPTAWDQVSDYLDKHADLGNAEVREILQTDDTLKVSKMLREWVSARILEVVDASTAKQNRRYRKPGLPPEADLFAGLAGNDNPTPPQPPDLPST